MTGPRVIGIDPGCEFIGLAPHEGAPHTLRFRETDRGERASAIMTRIRPYLIGHDLAVLEGYAYHAGNKSLTRSAEAKGAILAAVYELGLEVVPDVPPTSLKLFATGSGGADKDDIIEAAGRYGFSPPALDEHQADAIVLRRMGEVVYADAETHFDYQRDAIARVNWPDVALRR